MSELPLWIIFIGALFLIGALVSLLALLQPVHRWGQRNPAARGALLCILGLVSFVISFSGLTRLEAQATYHFGVMTIVDTFGPAGARIITPPKVNESFVISELWVRLLLPPSLRPPCSTGEAWVCAQADRVVSATSAQWGWSAYWMGVELGSVSAVASSILGWLFTRQSKLQGNKA
jgi:hypothetical protein